MTDLTLSFCQQNPVVLNNEVLSINWGIIVNIFIILQLYLDNIFYDTLTFNVFVLFEGAYSVKKMFRNVYSSNKGKALFYLVSVERKAAFSRQDVILCGGMPGP